MRKLIPLLFLLPLILVTLATPAHAGIKKPCGPYSLVAKHAASVDNYDLDWDGWHCSGPIVDIPGGGEGPADNDWVGGPWGDAFFSYYDNGGSAPELVNTRKNFFRAVTGKPECDCTKLRTFLYQRNDSFYVDHGPGSRLVTLEVFEQAMKKAADSPYVDRYEFEVHYAPPRSHRSVYSLHRR